MDSNLAQGCFKKSISSEKSNEKSILEIKASASDKVHPSDALLSFWNRVHIPVSSTVKGNIFDGTNPSFTSSFKY